MTTTAPQTPPQTAPTADTPSVYAAILTLVSTLIALAFDIAHALGDGPPITREGLTAQSVALVGALWILWRARRPKVPPSVGGSLVSFLLPIALVGGVSLTGCASSTTHRPDPSAVIVTDVRQGPPCVQRVTVDGREVFRLEYAGRCPVEVTP